MSTPDTSDLPYACREHIKNKLSPPPQANQQTANLRVTSACMHVYGKFREVWAGSAAIRDGLGRVETEERKRVRD